MSNIINTPLVSIGIPFYNAEKYISFAITSVLNQSYENWELFLMDDGSSDNSLEIANNFKNSDKRIKVFSNGENLGLPTRLNQLSNLATGAYYARMDADDIMHPERIEKQVNYLINHAEIDLLSTNLISIDNNNDILGIRNGSTKKQFFIKDLIKFGGWCAHPTVMGKTSWFKENKYNEKLTRTEDIDLWFRTIEHSNFSKIDFIGLYYREESTPTLQKYLFSSRQLFQLYWIHRKKLGIYYFLRNILYTLLKICVFLLYSVFGKMNKIIARRSQKVEKNLLIDYQNNLLSAIKNN